jgi:anthranilate synthase/aminodeoxychorismate synthase-like glutamine amidotransferase
VILIVDNYDSFVHNLARYAREEGGDALVLRNDEADVGDLLALNPAGVILSPGPRRPEDAGVCLDLLARLPPSIPVLGVCLGHQCLIASDGGAIRKARRPLHGEACLIRHDGDGVLAGVPNPFAAGRYHSLIGELRPGSAYIANAFSEEGEIMGVRHANGRRHGVQFHPESLLTPAGRTIIRNFLALAVAA